MGLQSQTTIANRHDFTTTFTNEYAANQSAVTIATPSTGKQLVVTGVYVSAEGGALGNMITLKFGTNTAFKFHANTTAINVDSGQLVVEGGVDVPLKLTSDLNDKSYYIAVNYREE